MGWWCRLSFTNGYCSGVCSAFSTVVADPPFSPLGIVLVAALARLARIVHANCPEEDAAQTIAVDADGATAPAVATNTAPKEDIGELISRSEIMTTKATEEMEVDTAANTEAMVKKTKRTQEKSIRTQRVVKRQRTEQEMKVKKRSKKRKGNAIDDIFGDLF